MLEESTIAELAQRLQRAEDEKTFIRMFSIDHPGMTIEDAYAIQRAWTAIKLAKGRVVKGHKIGLTSRAMQSAVGIDEPDYGVLFDDMFWNDGAVIPFDKYLSARIEVENQGPNDLPMLQWAGRAVAMANAHPTVLAAIAEVTESNEDDGVAVVLESLLASGG